MPIARRFTTEYVDQEDRIRIAHELDQPVVQINWLTRRLLDRLVTHLIGSLEKSLAPVSRPDVMQAFVQEAAIAQLTPEPAVKPAIQAQSWLVVSIDLNWRGSSLSLVFKGAKPEQEIIITMNAIQLRQWLRILHVQYTKAGWDLSAWPDWMLNANQGVPATPNIVH